MKHQRFVGTGYFDEIQNAVTTGKASTRALDHSTEAEQFDATEPANSGVAAD